MSRRRRLAAAVAALAAVAAAGSSLDAQQPVRARDLGIPFEGQPGRSNAITDVPGVEVGHETLIRGSGRLVPGEGPVRTGVTAILPRGRSLEPVFAGWHNLNGNGEMTGTAWVEESGLLAGPVLITNTHSVGVARDAAVEWLVSRDSSVAWALPVVAETWDGRLNDLNGFHVRREHVFAALESASGGQVLEGAVGGGTGMICHGFKGGIGTASRVLPAEQGGWTVGVLVQCNYGGRADLRLAGVPVGAELDGASICRDPAVEPSRPSMRRVPACDVALSPDGLDADAAGKSIIIVVATDAPLLPHQLERIAQRPTLALGRMGSISSNYSGDLFLAFSTAAHGLDGAEAATVQTLPPGRLDPLFRATVEATEEAIVNALVAAETMTGADGLTVRELPHDGVRAILRRHGRLAEGPEAQP